MKSLVELLECLLIDIERQTGADLRRDSSTIWRRVANEGDSFLTITLPSFCQAFERGLADGRLDPHGFPAFKKRGRRAALPAFLQGLLLQVFDQTGQLLSEPRVDCIRAVRQICLFCKKVRRPCSPERERAAIRAYKRCEEEIALDFSGQLWRYFVKVGEILIEDLMPGRLGGVKPPIMPKHGPGATQERVYGNRKWSSLARRWHSRLEQTGLNKHGLVYPEYPVQGIHDVFPQDVARNQLAQRRWQENYDFWKLPDARLLSPEEEPPVRVVFVPKTLKSPRVIAVEPVCMQFVQQGLARFLMDRIEHSVYTAGHVNFTRQTVNQALAQEGSRLGHLATLDLSEASDRVALCHVRGLFRSKPDFLAKLEACRTGRAQLPDGEVIPLRKFASMGSALCFPIESLVFYTIIVAARLLRAGLFPDRRNVREFGRDVYVYGDDLIVPADEAPAIVDELEGLGLKVNRHKSFWTGQFRESCGVDCYAGEMVTPIYLRSDIPTNGRDVAGILSSVATANQLFEAGYRSTATAIKDSVEALTGLLPQVTAELVSQLDDLRKFGKPPTEPVAIGWAFPSAEAPRRRWNKHLQRFEYFCLVPYTDYDDDPLEGYDALAKCFRTVRGSEQNLAEQFSSAVEDHLDRSVRRYALGLRRTWVPGPIGPGG